MIICPALKVDASPGYDPNNFLKGHPASQGAVSWGNCIKCKSNIGFDEKSLKIKCGHDPKNIITLESIPI
jgi:hypothetical protein